MAASPKYKVFNPNGQYIASCKYPEDAGVLVAHYGDGAYIAIGHSKSSIVWHEGMEAQPACESWDFVAETVYTRERALNKQYQDQISQYKKTEISFSVQDNQTT